MKLLFISMLFLIIGQSFAKDDLQKQIDSLVKGDAQITQQDVNNLMVASFANMKISKQDMAKMIDQMVSSGQITKKDADAAKKELNKMSDKDMEKFRMTLMHMMTSGAAKPR